MASATLDDYNQALTEYQNQKYAESNHSQQVEEGAANLLALGAQSAPEIGNVYKAVAPWVSSGIKVSRAAAKMATAAASKDPKKLQDAKNSMWDAATEVASKAAARATGVEPKDAQRVTQRVKAAMTMGKAAVTGTPEDKQAALKQVAQLYPEGNQTRQALEAAGGDADALKGLISNVSPVMGRAQEILQQSKKNLDDIQQGKLNENSIQEVARQLEGESQGISSRLQQGKLTPEDHQLIASRANNILTQQSGQINSAIQSELQRRNINVQPEDIEKLRNGTISLSDINRLLPDASPSTADITSTVSKAMRSSGDKYLKSVADGIDAVHAPTDGAKQTAWDRFVGGLKEYLPASFRESTTKFLNTQKGLPADAAAIRKRANEIAAAREATANIKRQNENASAAPDNNSNQQASAPAQPAPRSSAEQEADRQGVRNGGDIQSRLEARLRTLDEMDVTGDTDTDTDTPNDVMNKSSDFFSAIKSRLSDLGGKITEGAKKVGQAVVGGVSTGARKASEAVEEAATRVKARLTSTDGLEDADRLNTRRFDLDPEGEQFEDREVPSHLFEGVPMQRAAVNLASSVKGAVDEHQAISDLRAGSDGFDSVEQSQVGSGQFGTDGTQSDRPGQATTATSFFQAPPKAYVPGEVGSVVGGTAPSAVEFAHDVKKGVSNALKDDSKSTPSQTASATPAKPTVNASEFNAAPSATPAKAPTSGTIGTPQTNTQVSGTPLDQTITTDPTVAPVLNPTSRPVVEDAQGGPTTETPTVVNPDVEDGTVRAPPPAQPVESTAQQVSKDLSTVDKVEGETAPILDDATEAATAGADAADGNVFGAILNGAMLASSTALEAVGLAHHTSIEAPPPPVVAPQDVAQTNENQLDNPLTSSTAAV